MQRLDLRILAAFFHHGAWQFTDWDPRVSVRAIAKRAGLAPTTVWERLRAWQDAGVLQGFGVLPNPRILGRHLATQNVRLHEPTDRPAFVEEALATDEVVLAVEHLGGWVSIGAFEPSPAASADRAARLSEDPRIAEVDDPHVWAAVRMPPRAPDTRDLEIISGLIGERGLDLEGIARDLGLSERTVQRRYARLLKDHVVMSTLLLDLTRTENIVANLILTLEEAADPAAVGIEARRRIPDLLRFSPGLADPDGRPLPLWQGFVALANVAAVEEAALTLQSVPGVSDVEVSHPLRFHLAQGWVETELARARAAFAE